MPSSGSRRRGAEPEFKDVGTGRRRRDSTEDRFKNSFAAAAFATPIGQALSSPDPRQSLGQVKGRSRAAHAPGASVPCLSSIAGAKRCSRRPFRALRLPLLPRPVPGFCGFSTLHSRTCESSSLHFQNGVDPMNDVIHPTLLAFVFVVVFSVVATTTDRSRPREGGWPRSVARGTQ